MKKEIKQVLRSFDGLDNRDVVTQTCKDFAGTFQKINKKNFSRYVELLRNTALVLSAKKVPANEKGFLSFEVSGNDFFIIKNNEDILFKNIPEYDGYESCKNKFKFFFCFSNK